MGHGDFSVVADCWDVGRATEMRRGANSRPTGSKLLDSREMRMRRKFKHEKDCPCSGDWVEHAKECRNCECQPAPPAQPERPSEPSEWNETSQASAPNETAEWHAWFFNAKRLWMNGDPKEFEKLFLSGSPYGASVSEPSEK